MFICCMLVFVQFLRSRPLLPLSQNSVHTSKCMAHCTHIYTMLWLHSILRYCFYFCFTLQLHFRYTHEWTHLDPPPGHVLPTSHQVTIFRPETLLSTDTKWRQELCVCMCVCTGCTGSWWFPKKLWPHDKMKYVLTLSFRIFVTYARAYAPLVHRRNG